MISKKIKREDEKGERLPDNVRFLGLYIADAKNEGEKVLFKWHEGCQTDAADYLGAMVEIETTQDLNTRARNERTYHLMLSFNPEDEDKLSEDVLKAIERKFAEGLGFETHQRLCGVHKDTDNLHMHIAYSMINPDTLNIRHPYRDYIIRDKICREVEQQYGLVVDNGRDAETRYPKPNEKARTMEIKSGCQSFSSYVAERKERLFEAIETAKNWPELHEAFAKHGLEIKLQNNGMIIKDRNSVKNRIKLSELDRSVSKPKLTAKFGEFVAADGKTFAEAERYAKKPISDHPAVPEFYKKFEEQLEEKRLALESIDFEKKAQIETARQKWDKKREDLARAVLSRQDRAKLIKYSRLKEKEEIAKISSEAYERKNEAKDKRPYASWNGFLQYEARQNNPVALEILRSMRWAVMPAQKKNNPFQEERQRKEAIKAEFREAQGATLQNRNLQYRNLGGQTNMLKVKEFAALNNLDLNFKIDHKGTVIIKLPTGGSVRDHGLEITYSHHDRQAKIWAESYAKHKWGKLTKANNNTIQFALKALEKGPQR